MDSYKIQAKCDVCEIDIEIFFTWYMENYQLDAYATSLSKTCLKKNGEQISIFFVAGTYSRFEPSRGSNLLHYTFFLALANNH